MLAQGSGNDLVKRKGVRAEIAFHGKGKLYKICLACAKAAVARDFLNAISALALGKKTVFLHEQKV